MFRQQVTAGIWQITKSFFPSVQIPMPTTQRKGCEASKYFDDDFIKCKKWQVVKLLVEILWPSQR